MDTEIVFDAVTKRFGPTLAVDRLTATVRPGRVTAFLIGLAGSGMDDAPPFFVIAIGAALGVVTLAALRPALRQQSGGLWTVICSRLLSALWGLPVFFADDAPGWAQVATVVSLALTAAGVGLLVPFARRPASQEARTA